MTNKTDAALDAAEMVATDMVTGLDGRLPAVTTISVASSSAAVSAAASGEGE